MSRLDFLPGRDGFHFRNNFENVVRAGPITFRTLGRCGGMAAAALDYYRARIPIPAHVPDDLGPNGVPDDGSRLSTYIYDRLITTIANVQALKFITMPWVTDADCFRWSVEDEFPRCARLIDAGRLHIVGLWGTTAGFPGGGHQVVCYGYETSPPRLWVYDNNFPDRECQLVPVSPSEGISVVDLTTGATLDTYRGFFWHDVFDWDGPGTPPPYVDLAVSAGLTFQPNDNLVLGTRLECSVAVRNYGEFPSRLQGLILFVRDPNGENLDQLLGPGDGNATPIQPGEERLLARVNDTFGTVPGVYTIGVSYLSHLGYWRPLPAGDVNAQPQRQLSVLRPGVTLAEDRVIEVPESAYDCPTGITVQPGDEIAFSAEGRIWAGVWGTGENGPAGWNRIDNDPKFPLHDGPNARPFALLGRYAGLGYFYIGDGLPREAYAGGVPRPLFLRVNDDMPGNGSGSFRCRVQVWR